MAERRAELDAAAAVLLTVFCATWGFQQVAIKVAIPAIPPLLQAGLRSAGALALLLVWTWWQRIPLTRRDGTLWYGVAAGLLFGFEFVFIYLGLDRTTASRSVLFIYTSPFFVALGAHLFLPGERLRVLQVVGLLAAFAGIVLAFADGLNLPTWRELGGDLMVMLGALLWAATTILIKGSPLLRASPSKVLAYQLAVSAAVLLGLSAALGERSAVPPGLVAWSSLLYQTVIVAFVSYLGWFWMVGRYPAARLAAFTFLTPLFGLAFGGLFLGDRITPALAAAVALVSVGIWLVNRPVRAPADPVRRRAEAER